MHDTPDILKKIITRKREEIISSLQAVSMSVSVVKALLLPYFYRGWKAAPTVEELPQPVRCRVSIVCVGATFLSRFSRA